MASKVFNILEDYSNKFVDAFIDSLRDKDRYASGTSAQDIIPMPVREEDGNIVMEIRMPKHLDFVDKGVSGTKKKYSTKFSFKGKNINQKAMLKHIANRGLSVKAKKGLSKENARKGLAFVLGRKIAKTGLRPTNFIGEVMEGDLMKEMQQEVLEAIGEEVVVNIVFD